jgi:uncharacterized membrane protein YeaQ/YmgE (transglycosylase-associated protein family)
MRSLKWIGLFAGSTIGSLIPALFGANTFSIWSLIFSVIGAALGVWLSHQYEDNL